MTPVETALYRMRVFDLYMFLRDSKRANTNFTNILFELIFKSDPNNLSRIGAGFPIEVKVVEDWRAAPQENQFFKEWGYNLTWDSK